mmetsp:Transcript_10122/g.29983  ORF Transcript_10122/g.29983 Transcript_10122/m.29983 type:complete len:226 (+) Transcript_10122:853-1530(+)
MLPQAPHAARAGPGRLRGRAAARGARGRGGRALLREVPRPGEPLHPADPRRLRRARPPGLLPPRGPGPLRRRLRAVPVHCGLLQRGLRPGRLDRGRRAARRGARALAGPAAAPAQLPLPRDVPGACPPLLLRRLGEPGRHVPEEDVAPRLHRTRGLAVPHLRPLAAPATRSPAERGVRGPRTDGCLVFFCLQQFWEACPYAAPTEMFFRWPKSSRRLWAHPFTDP